MSHREPVLQPVKITQLHPTQMTVGMREVEEKRERWRKAHGKKKEKFLGSHMIPVLKGPKDGFYVIDHHHLALALHEEGQKDVLVNVIFDLSMLTRGEFWTVCDAKGWTHPYDKNGNRRDFSKIPRSIVDLEDDPYRSLAGELRRAGGYAKDTTPFSEFLWAGFLRTRVKRNTIDKEFGRAIKQALTHARSMDANYLPGWCGQVTDAS
jgi:hypothetical protein